MQKITEVRRFSDGGFWVVDILSTHTASDGYVRPGGTVGLYYEYTTKELAEAAETLYLLTVEPSAGEDDVLFKCSNCKRQKAISCPYVSRSVPCKLFEPRTPVGETKETNPKDIIGMKKAPMSTLSCAVLFEMGLGMLEGARKYGRHNYRAMGVSATVYYDAAMGHLMDWFEGEDIDLDSGMNHITKAMTTLLVLRDSMLCGNWIDDRPLRNPNKLYKKHFNPKAEEIIEKYPDCVAPYLENNKDLDRSK